MENENHKYLIVRFWVLRILLVIYDAFVVNFAYFMAIIIRFYVEHRFHDMGAKYIEMMWKFAPYYTVGSLLIFVVFRLYSGAWRYVGINDISRLMLANFCTCTFQIIGSLLIVGRMPITYYAIGAFLQVCLMGLPRVVPRFVLDSFGSGSGTKEVSLPMMIVGVGENARIIQSMSMKNKNNAVNPVCVTDFRHNSGSTLCNGRPVYFGKDGLTTAVEKHDVKSIILADDKLSEDETAQIHKICTENNIEFRSFAMKFEHRDGGIHIKELLEKVDGPVKIVNTDRVDKYDSGAKAIEDYKNNYIVESIKSEPDAVCIKVHRIQTASISEDEEWVQKYKEENRGEVSFFV